LSLWLRLDAQPCPRHHAAVGSLWVASGTVVLCGAVACGLGRTGLGSDDGPQDAQVDSTAGGDVTLPGPDAGTDGNVLDGSAPDSATNDGSPQDATQGDEVGPAGDPGVICGDASCPLGMTCKGCMGGSWTCTGCAGMPMFLLNCDDWADCDGGACCVVMGGGPVTTQCTSGTTCMPDHPLCDPNAANPCPYGGTCKAIDGMLMGTPYHNCRM
jgi:hypothetical protein